MALHRKAVHKGALTMEMWMYEDRRYRKLGRMKVAVAVLGGTALVGAGASLFGSSEQASAEKDATNSANATQLQMYNQNRADQAPYRQAGYGALNTITQDQANGTGFAKPFDQSSFQSDPGYQFQLQQGNQAIQRSAAAQGGLLSGAAGKAIAGYTTNLANTSYGDAYNRYLQTSNQQYNQLASVAGLGQSATQSTAASGTNAANQVANNTIAGGVGAANASASGIVGASNSLTGGANNLSQYYMLKNAGMFGGGGYGTVPTAGMDMYGG
jgi:hypothetical protein